MDLAANLVNPLLVACALAAPFLARERPRPFWLRVAAGLALVYLVTGLDRWLGVGRELGFDFSTHTAFATVVATSLALLERRWLWLVVPLLAAYATLMIRLEYHTLPEFAFSLLLFAPVTWAIRLPRAGRAGYLFL